METELGGTRQRTIFITLALGIKCKKLSKPFLYYEVQYLCTGSAFISLLLLTSSVKKVLFL